MSNRKNLVYLIFFCFILSPFFSKTCFPDSWELHVSGPPPAKLQEQADQYNKNRPKTIYELQQFRTSVTVNFKSGRHDGQATLTNLNPYANSWFVLSLKKNQKSPPEIYHLQNPFPKAQTLSLFSEFPFGILIQTKDGQYPCNLWETFPENKLTRARKSSAAFAPLCDNRLFLRNKTKGRKTMLESASDFVRRYIPAGEKITTFVKDKFYKDKFAISSEILKEKQIGENIVADGPRVPEIDLKYHDTSIIPEELGLPFLNKGQSGVLCGQWYPVKDMPGIFVSAVEPKMISKKIAEKQGKLVKPLSSIESSALVLLTAFDLDRYDLAFAMGTDHPEVDWSERIRPHSRNWKLPGPDGIRTIRPLVNTGIINPENAIKIVAAFTGGFKRYHGAFRNGSLAQENHASHYGFIEHGIVMSKLHPGLATIIIYKDNRVEMKTWQDKDNKQLSSIVFARQNGVPIIETGESGQVTPGRYVTNAYKGNWSGSAEGNLRTLRAGMGIQEHDLRRFLIYAYFSTATPSAMARIFQAYHCNYAMLTDMNALEHTYLALYLRTDKGLKINHLVKGMKVLDKRVKGNDVPRFLGFPDNRDFFYVMKKEQP